MKINVFGPKMALKTSQDGPKTAPRPLLAALEAYVGVLKQFRVALGASRGGLGPVWGRHGAFVGGLDGSWGAQGRLWGRTGALRDGSGDAPGPQGAGA